MTTPLTRGACPICHSADTTTRAQHGRAFVDLACNQCGAWWRADALTRRLVAYDADICDDARDDIIERYSTSAEQQEEATELLDDADLVSHLAGLFDQLEAQIETLPADDPRRAAAIATRDQALADLEAITGNVAPAQLELVL